MSTHRRSKRAHPFIVLVVAIIFVSGTAAPAKAEQRTLATLAADCEAMTPTESNNYDEQWMQLDRFWRNWFQYFTLSGVRFYCGLDRDSGGYPSNFSSHGYKHIRARHQGDIERVWRAMSAGTSLPDLQWYTIVDMLGHYVATGGDGTDVIEGTSNNSKSHCYGTRLVTYDAETDKVASRQFAVVFTDAGGVYPHDALQSVYPQDSPCDVALPALVAPQASSEVSPRAIDPRAGSP